MVANVGAKEFRKPCELCYIHRYYDSVVTNMNPHNIFLIFLSFKTHGELRCIRTPPVCCEYACCLNSPCLIHSQKWKALGAGRQVAVRLNAISEFPPCLCHQSCCEMPSKSHKLTRSHLVTNRVLLIFLIPKLRHL